jgi:Na+/melibiose symporter-like transporter
MLLMAGLALILIYLTEGSTLGWLSIEELVFLIPGIALIFGFFVFESKVVSPLIQLSLLKVRNVLIANLVVMVAGLANFLVFFAVVYFAEQPVPYGLGLDILSTGLMLAPATVAMLIVGPIAGRMVTKIGPKPVLLSGSLVSMVSYVLFIVNRATEAAVIVDAIVAFAG